MTDAHASTVLVVGETPSTARVLSVASSVDGVETTGANSAEAPTLLESEVFDAVVAGTQVGEMSGVEFAAVVQQADPDARVVLVDDEQNGISETAADAVGVEAVLRAVPEMDQHRLQQKLEETLGIWDEETRYERTRARLETLFDNSADPIFIYTPDGEILDVNEAASEAMGYTVDELRQRRIWEIDPQFTETELRAAWGEMDPGDTATFEGALQRTDGSTFPIEVHTQKFTVEGDERLVAQVRDVTERERARDRLEANREALEELYRITSDPERTFEERVEAVLALGREYLGVAGAYVAELSADTQRLLYTDGDLDVLEPGLEVPRERTYCRRTVDHDGPLAVTEAPEEGWEDDPAYETFGLDCYLGTTVRVRDDDYGTVCFIDTEARAESFSEEEVTFVELVSQWVSDKLTQQTQQAELREREQQLTAVTDNVPLVLFAYDDEGTFTLSQGAGLEKLGLEPGEVVGESVFDVYEDHEQVLSQAERALSGETVRERTPVGDAVYDTHITPILEDGEVRAVVGVSRDITELVSRERELERYEAIVENMDDIAFVVDEDWAIEFANAEALHRAQRDREDVVGQNIQTVTAELCCDEDTATRFKAALWAVSDGYIDSDRVQVELELPEGVVVGEYQLSALKTDAGERKLIALARDVTERVWREQALEQTRERLTVAMEGSDAGVWEWDPETDEVFWHETCERLFGLDPGEFEGTYEAFAEYVHDEDLSTLESAIEESLPDRDPFEAEYRIETADGETLWTYARGEFVDIDGLSPRYVGVITDITGLKERERELDRERAFVESVLDSLPDVLYAVEPDGTLRRWNDRVTEVTGYSDEELQGMSAMEFIPEDDRDEVIAAMNQSLAGEQRRVESGYVTKDGEVLPYEFTGAPIEDENGEVVGLTGVGRDITDRKRYEETLTSLHSTTRELVRSASPEEVCRRVVDTGAAVLDVSGAATLLYDREESALVTAAWTGMGETDGVSPPVVGPEATTAWEAYVEGETRVADGAEEMHLRANGSGGEGLCIPMGDHGLFVVTTDGETVVEDQVRDLAEVLAANAEVALDRLDRERELRERDEQLRERAERLEQLDEVNERVREITHRLVGTETREDIESVVCEGLASAERFDLAWIGTYDAHAGAVDVQTWAGSERGYLDAVALDERGGELEPAVAAARDRELSTVTGVAQGLREADWRQEALSRGYQSVLAVPIRHGGVPYGVLAVYANSTTAFDEETEEVFEELGTTVAHAIRTVEQRQALLTDTQVELEFDVTDGKTTLYAVSDRLPGRLTVERVLPQAEGRHLVYGAATGVDREAFLDAARETTGIAEARVVSVDDGTLRVELQVTGPSLATTIAAHGGAFQELTATGGDGTVSMVFPAGAEINEFIDMFVERFPGTELVARRERSAGVTSSMEDPDRLLTDRQREVLEAAVHSGFFEWPRDSNGEEVAESLGISAPTFQEHLRHAQRKILESHLDAEDVVLPADDD